MKTCMQIVLVAALINNTNAVADDALKSAILKIGDMPYICRGIEGSEGCGDRYYWENIRKGNIAVPGLIELIDDNTDVGLAVPNFGGNYTVGDIAVIQIRDIHTDFPLEAIIKNKLGYSGGSEMGGFWYYWRFVRENPENRTLLKKEVYKWWHR